MKKVLSLALVLVLVLGMSTMAFAASKTYTKLDKSGDQAIITMGGTTEPEVDVEVQKANQLVVYSDVIDFSDCDLADGYTIDNRVSYGSAGVTGLVEKDIKNSSITLKTVLSKGAVAINTDDTELSYANIGGDNAGKLARIKIEFNDEFKSNNTDGIDYTVKFFLIVDGRQWNATGLTLEGNYKNLSDNYSDASDGYVYMGDGIIIKADEYGKNIEMDLDNGVSVFGKMFKDKKYWAVANMDSYNDDEDQLMDKYDIDTVYHIKQVGVAAVADYVLLNDEDADMFVYDGEFNYLGKGNAKLAFSETYYLSAKQLEIEDEDEPIEDGDETDGPELSDDLGGDDDYPANVNDNPGTGC